MIIQALRILRQQGPGALFSKIIRKRSLRQQYGIYLLAQKASEHNKGSRKEEANALQYRPKISIIVPVYNTDERWLRHCLESVRNQLYDNWELCVVDGGSTKPYIRTVLEGFAKQDTKILLRFLGENRGIAGNSNAALALATGDFVGFLDHDDELESSALYEVAKLLNENQDTDFIYSDEDKISITGKRMNPHFKPDWSPDTVYSHNYITHFAVIRKDIINDLGGFREGYDGSQDYDLFLRVMDRTQRIAHIPRVLYHWRMIPRSAASSSNAKPYARMAAKKAIKDSLGRREKEAGVLDGLCVDSYRVRYKIFRHPKVSVIVPARDDVKSLRRCIESVMGKTDYDHFEILIIDNQSKQSETLKYFDRVKENPKVRIRMYDGAYNYSEINNYAVSLTDSEYVIFLHNDTEVISREWLTAMLEHVQREEVGIAGGLLYYPNNTIQHAGVIIGIRGTAGHPHRHFSRRDPGYFHRARIIQDLSAVTGACMMIKKSTFERAGGFDGEFKVALGDIDLCLTIREEGFSIVYTPYAELYHYEPRNRGYEDAPENRAGLKKEMEYFQKKWKGVLAKGDPHYNPNLSLDREDFSIRN